MSKQPKAPDFVKLARAVASKSLEPAKQEKAPSKPPRPQVGNGYTRHKQFNY